MSRFYTLFIFGTVLLGGFLLFSSPAKAAGQCYCYTELTVPGNLTAQDINNPAKYDANCLELAEAECKVGTPKTGSPYTNCYYITSTPQMCLNEKSSWLKIRDTIIDQLLKQQKENAGAAKRKGLIGAILPACVFEKQVTDDCEDVSVFIKLAIDIAVVVFTIIGSLALAVFIYGGFTLILSEGSPEKVKKGTGAMMAAIIGLAIVFGAYLLVTVLSSAIGIEDKFNLLK